MILQPLVHCDKKKKEIFKRKPKHFNYHVNLLLGQGIWKQAVEKFPLLESFIKKLLIQLS